MSQLSSDEEPLTVAETSTVKDVPLSDDEVLQAAAECFWGESFTSQLEGFVAQHCETFSDDEEHKLEYTTLFNEYQELFDRCMTGCLEGIGVSSERFHGICQKAMESKDEESEQIQALVSMMTASMEFDVFLQEMRRMAQEKRDAVIE